MEAVRRLREVSIFTLFVLSIFALIGLQLFKGTLKANCFPNANTTAAHPDANSIHYSAHAYIVHNHSSFSLVYNCTTTSIVSLQCT